MKFPKKEFRQDVIQVLKSEHGVTPETATKDQLKKAINYQAGNIAWAFPDKEQFKKDVQDAVKDWFKVKSFKQIKEGKTPQVVMQPVVVGFFRFNPPTKEHGVIVQKVLDLAEEADHMIFLSQSVDESNPLECEQKVEFLKKYFPHVNFICDSKMAEPHSMLEHLNKKKYKEVILVSDPDREDQNKMFAEIIGHDKVFQFEAFRVEKADASDGDSSAKLIQLAKADKMKQFIAGTPNSSLHEVGVMMFNAVKGEKKPKK